MNALILKPTELNPQTEPVFVCGPNGGVYLQSHNASRSEESQSLMKTYESSFSALNLLPPQKGIAPTKVLKPSSIYIDTKPETDGPKTMAFTDYIEQR